MKDMSFVVCFLVGLSVTAFVLASEEKADCPQLCVCEIRPWFSPSSIYMEAPTIDCNDLGLFLLPERLPADTQVLLLQTNSIAKIEKPLDYLLNITEIDLSQNNLSSMSNINLGRLPQLLSLHMEENWIRTLPDNCLVDLTSLQELYINHNLISFIAPGAFLGLRNLLRLHLNSNRLQMINSQWFEATPRLEILMIGENPIIKIQDMNFKPLINLRTLVLARMNLSEMPDRALDGLNNLESISFYDNTFIQVPHAALKRVQSLKFLDLNKNPIQRIQRGDFMDMLHLKELGINSMPELVSIDSFALNNLPELTKIEATNNPKLSYIHPNAFYKLPKLETLMLNSNALSALHRITVESLPNLREVSMHSNPIRCDCVVRWINMNKTRIRFMEPESLFCAEPPEYEGQRVRQVHFREMMEICLPLISPESLPRRVRADNGSSISLHCRAFAEPEPDIYWITPSGDRVLPNTVSEKYRMYPEGTFDIYDVTEREAGLYTCVAHNLVGADLKSVLVEVNGYFPQPVNGSLKINIKSVQPDSVLVSWKASQGSLAPNIKWSTTSTADLPAMAFAARVPSDVKVYNLTRLSPSTQYEVCVDIPSIHHKRSRKCVNVTTKGLELAVKNNEAWDTTVIAVIAVLLGVISVACSLISVSLRKQHSFGDLRKSQLKPSLSPVGGLYSPLTRLFLSGKGLSAAVEVKATVIDVSNNS
ncbi:leucine-rich repeat neuronal protein 3-like [Megalops cyprinoides]|uniref:leucine-rich repeat neuronal protein 3-like n=1 Tax=Megalops cyprinoides TaxID=118141 RepID=UPI001864E2D0|nr:leucine-rich repeat neuronal protein 3-like [Megalops cyprinoides]